MLSQTYQEQVAECTRFLAPRLERPPEWGIVLGTGQSLWDSRLEGGECLPYEALPHFPPATSPGHHGRLCWGRRAGRQVMVCQGRFHAYEGYSMAPGDLPGAGNGHPGGEDPGPHQCRGAASIPTFGPAI